MSAGSVRSATQVQRPPKAPAVDPIGVRNAKALGVSDRSGQRQSTWSWMTEF